MSLLARYVVVAVLVALTAYASTLERPVAPAAVVEPQGTSRSRFYVETGPIPVWIDPRTRCEYFLDTGTPLFAADGRQLCDAEGATP